MEVNLIKYNLKVGEYGGFADIEIEIPKDVKFFYTPNSIGNMLMGNSEHHTTIVNKDKYSEWIEYVGTVFGVNIEEIGEYTIVTINSVHNDTKLPTIDRNEWFKQNNIDFSKYVLVHYSNNIIPISAFRIINFQDVWNIECGVVTRKSFFNDKEDFLSLERKWMGTDYLFPFTMGDRSVTVKTYEGAKAEVIWNTMINDVINACSFNEKYVDETYDFLAEQKEFCKKT